MKHIVLAFLFCADALGQVASIIPATNRVDWIPGVTVGVEGGIPNRTTVYKLEASGTSAVTLNTDLAACPSNQVVLLTNATFSFATTILIPSGVTLRGVSPAATKINLSSSASVKTAGTATIGARSTNLYTPFLLKGATNLATYSGAVPFSAGDYLVLNKNNDSALTKIFDGNTATNVWGFHCRVQSVSGTNFTIWPPLPWSLDASFYPTYMAASGSIYVKNAGVENLTIQGDSSVSYPIYMACADDCYVSNVVVTNVASQGIYNFRTIFNEVRHCAILKAQSGGDGYGILADIDSASNGGVTGLWAEDNIGDGLYHAIFVNAGYACAFSYNFATNDHASSGVTFPTGSFNGTHSPGGMMNLWEGNWGSAYFWADRIHGNTTHNVLWRNRLVGSANAASATNAHMPMLYLAEGSYWFSAVGNVLGGSWSSPGANRQYKYTQALWDAESSTDNGGILFLGYTTFGNSEEAKVGSTFTGYHNYDFYHAATFDETSIGGSPTVDNSLLYAAKPSWFVGTWPPIDAGTPNADLTVIPAGYRYVNGIDPSGGGVVNAVATGVRMGGRVR